MFGTRVSICFLIVMFRLCVLPGSSMVMRWARVGQHSHQPCYNKRAWTAITAASSAPGTREMRFKDIRHSRLQPQSRSMYIQTQATPNSDAVMFLPGREIMPGGVGSMDFPSLQTAASSPLARKILGVDGVRGVFFGAHFITITKGEDVEWTVLRPEIFEVLMDFFMDDKPIFMDGASEAWNSDTTITENDTEVVAMIKELLETRVKPAVAEDGGNILFRGFHENEGIVDLELQGACSSCSSSSVTLKSGVENMLRHYISEVKSVREVPGKHASPLERTNHEELSKVEQALVDKGILRS